MELDPHLTGIAIAAVGPTKLLVDFLALSLDDLEPAHKLLFGYLIAFLFILLYGGYTGEVRAAPDVTRLLAGYLLAAYSTLTGAVVLTEVQKRVGRKKDKPVGEDDARP